MLLESLNIPLIFPEIHAVEGFATSGEKKTLAISQNLYLQVMPDHFANIYMESLRKLLVTAEEVNHNSRIARYQ